MSPEDDPDDPGLTTPRGGLEQTATLDDTVVVGADAAGRALMPEGPPARLGDYALLERLGRGGEGTVYRARHVENGHVVALKMVGTGAGSSYGADARIRDEARAIASFRHPHIVRIHFSGADRGVWYYSMELMEGGSLLDHIEALRDDPRAAAALVEKVARGVHHAHSRGVLHLDLKPANVLLDGDGSPRVSDFGLALHVRGGTAAGAAEDCGGPVHASGSEAFASGLLDLSRAEVRGTAPFMSPEMAAGRVSAVTTAADVYGLGAILYAALTGRPPVVGEGMTDTLFNVVHGRVEPPRALNRRVDRELQAVCMKCLRKDPARRYGSADALANDLARWARREPTLAGEPTARKRAWFWLRRHPLAATAAVATALAFWLAGAVASVGQARAENRREAAVLAREAAIQVRMVGRAVALLAAGPEFPEALRDHPDGSPAQRRRLDALLARSTALCNSWFDVAGGNPVFNVFLLNADGVMLADTAPNSPSVGRTYALRDYFKHFQGPGAALPRDAVYLSRAFRSSKDGVYKVALATRVWDGPRCLGLLLATVGIGPGLVVLDMRAEAPGAAVASPVDWAYAYRAPDTTPVDRPPFLAVLHAAYARPGTPPVWLAPADYPLLAAFDRDPRLDEAEEAGRGGAVTHYRRVGSTGLVVVLRRPYPWALRPFLDPGRRPWAVASLGLLGLVPVALCAAGPRTRPGFFSRPGSA